MRGRMVAYGLLAAVLVAMLAPPLRSPPVDSYPLSTYPMFSSDRGSRSRVATVVGIDADGSIHRLDPELIGGSDEPMLAVATAARAAAGSPANQRELCKAVAERVARAAGDDTVAVVLRVEEHDTVRSMSAPRPVPNHTTDLERCEVPR